MDKFYLAHFYLLSFQENDRKFISFLLFSRLENVEKYDSINILTIQ